MTYEVVNPFFLGSPGREIFVLYRGPANPSSTVLLVPPFAEEMNKSRRQFMTMSELLAKHGFATLIADFRGTGDSHGEFSQATWVGWRQDIEATIVWAQQNVPKLNAVIALRLGCILAAEVLQKVNLVLDKVIFWQPVISGRQGLTQFLRLRVAASMMDAKGKETVKELRTKLQQGKSLEVAGYELPSQLALDVDELDLFSSLPTSVRNLQVVEIGSIPQDALSMQGQKLIHTASQQGTNARGLRLTGEPFWSSTEIVINHELCQTAVDFLGSDK